MKNFTQMNESQTIDALNKEIQRKNEQIIELKKAVAKYQKKYDDVAKYQCVSSLYGY